MPEMDDLTLIEQANTMSKDAVTYNSEFMKENEYLFDRFLSRLYGDEEEEHSKVTSNDVEDSVNAYMVSLARVFLGSSEIIEFEPRNPDDEQDVAEADQKTKYADWLIRRQKNSYHTQYSALLEILLFKFGAVKYFPEKLDNEVIEETYTAISPEEAALFEQSLDGEDVESIEITEKTGDFDGVNGIDLKFKVTKKPQNNITVRSIPPECFIISKDALNKEEAPVVGDDTPITRGELVEMGYDKEEISRIPRYSGQKNEVSRMEEIRNQDQGSDTKPWHAPTWASEQVLLKTRFARIDYDGDGVAERRYLLYAGQVLLENEMFDHVPYAIGSAHLMPHRAIGRSVGEQACPFALQNTTLLRGINDNIYSVQAPRLAHNESVNQDDLLDQEHGATVRVAGKNTNPAASIQPIAIPYIGDRIMQVLQLQFQRRADSIGTMISSQGLEADDFAQETATRFEGVQDQGKDKVELVARNIAETFYKDLYEGVIWMATHFQNTEQEISVLGEQLSVNPGEWKTNHDVDVKVGLGSGDEDHVVETMSAILNLTNAMQQKGSPLVDTQTEYNTVKTMLKGLGISNVSKYFNDPSQPDELILAENEQLKRKLQEMDLQIQQLENPLAEAEVVKREGEVAIARGKLDMESAKLREEQRQFNIRSIQDQQKIDNDKENDTMDNAIDITKLELENNKDLAGGL